MNKIICTIFLLVQYFVNAQIGIDAVLDSYKKDKDLQHATYSFCVLDATSGKTIKEYNS